MLKPILLLLLLISALFNVFLLRNMLMNRELIDKAYMDQPFSFYEPQAQYLIEKNSTGTYSVNYSGEKGSYSFLVGSSQVPLDEYLDKNIKLEANFRPILGTPMCHKKCDGTYNAPVVDIQEITEIN